MPDLSPQPEPVTEEPQLRPGGVDALDVDPDGAGLPRDLDPDNSPVGDVMPEEVTEPDDKDQAPSGQADHEAGTDGTPSAGQTAEDGSPEPPA